ncbi:hypothetical protein BIV60_21850 [Bacillus sp. MUM 116]|uniref:DUF1871 family protein n=1 Tax=Bacillus sp. MUM 116 TaxID=1678002 RepID=UPI0008F5EA45|nr:DUF1871 family protein [Bacillus sp. MUM 116]OIK10269.1 hypothetical protein BIV60_21850 [Bacillus sp. MUM 116]
MENSQLQTNLKFVDLLNQWNPFQLEEGSYDTEIADTIQAIHELNHPAALAEKIQSIYEFSFEQIIPIDSCLEMAEKLLIIKNNDSCTI